MQSSHWSVIHDKNQAVDALLPNLTHQGTDFALPMERGNHNK
jgi:hypothetical protein